MMRAAIALLALCAAAAPAAADPHPMASGANPAPADSTQVAMTKEDLRIALTRTTADVVATITLENRGPATSMLVGFPCATGDAAGQIDVPCKTPVTVTLRGKKVKVIRKRESASASHWIWPMRLAAGEQVPLVVRYRAPLINERYSVPTDGMGVFTYRLTTGARWAGPIGSLQITVDHLNDALLFVSPAGYRREPGRITWSFTDHEPTEEVIVMPLPHPQVQVAGKTAAEVKARLDAGDVAKENLEEVIEELGRGGEWMERWPSMIAPLGGVPAPTREQVEQSVAESIELLKALAARAKR